MDSLPAWWIFFGHPDFRKQTFFLLGLTYRNNFSANELKLGSKNRSTYIYKGIMSMNKQFRLFGTVTFPQER